MTGANSSALRERLRNVYWIGGGSAAGKSTVAQRVADRYGFSVYSTDDRMADHARRSSPDACPLLHAFMQMDMDERWVKRKPETMLETFHWFKGEGFDMIIEDLLALPPDAGVIVEGFRLLPALVKPLVTAPRHAVWLLPTTDCRSAVMAERVRVAKHFLTRTSDPSKALANLLARDELFTDILRREIRLLELEAIEVDETMTEDDLVLRVASMLGLR